MSIFTISCEIYIDIETDTVINIFTSYSKVLKNIMLMKQYIIIITYKNIKKWNRFNEDLGKNRLCDLLNIAK